MLVRKEFIEEVRELGRVRCLSKTEFKEEFSVDPDQVNMRAEPVQKPGGQTQDMFRVWVGPKDAFEITHLLRRAYMQDTMVDNGQANFLRSQQHSTFMRAQAHVHDMRSAKTYKSIEDVRKEASAVLGHAAAAAAQSQVASSSVPSASTQQVVDNGQNSDDEKEFGSNVNKRQRVGAAPTAKSRSITLEDTKVLHMSIVSQIANWQTSLPVAVLTDHGRALQKTAAGLRAESRFNEVIEVDEMHKELLHIKALTACFHKAFQPGVHRKMTKSFVTLMDKTKEFHNIVEHLGGELKRAHLEAAVKISLCGYPGKPLGDSIMVIDIPYILAGMANRAEAIQLVEDLVELALNAVNEVFAAQSLRGKTITAVAVEMGTVLLELKEAPDMLDEVKVTLELIRSVMVADASGAGFGDAFDQMRASKHSGVHRVFYAHGDFSNKLISHVAALDDIMKKSAESTAITRNVIVDAGNMLTQLAQGLSKCS
jgi:hypothetical protein